MGTCSISPTDTQSRLSIYIYISTEYIHPYRQLSEVITKRTQFTPQMRRQFWTQFHPHIQPTNLRGQESGGNGSEYCGETLQMQETKDGIHLSRNRLGVRIQVKLPTASCYLGIPSYCNLPLLVDHGRMALVPVIRHVCLSFYTANSGSIDKVRGNSNTGKERRRPLLGAA